MICNPINDPKESEFDQLQDTQQNPFEAKEEQSKTNQIKSTRKGIRT